MLAYSQDAGIVLRSLAHRTGVVLDGTDGGSFPTFSPDSQQIAFARGGVLYRTSITGGAPSEVTRAWVFPGLDWGEDGYLYYASGVGTSGIWRVRAQGGELPERVTTVRDADDENLHSWPQLLPGGKALLYTAVGPSGGAVDSRVMVQTLESDSPRILVEAAIYGRYVRSGHLIYAKNDGTLYAARLDAATLKMGETHAAIQSDVATAIWGGAAFVVASATGTEVYLPRSDQTAFDFHLTDRQGRLTGPSITSEVMARIGRSSMLGDLSPDGQQIAVTGESPGAIDIWVLPVGGSEPRRLTLDPAEDEFPVWKSDGSAIAYTSANTGTTRRIIVQELNGGRRVVRTWPRHAHVNAWSPDGRWLILSNYTKTHEEDLWGLSIDGRNLLPVATSSSSEGDAAFSFDGNWLAYSSSDRDSQEIFVTSFPSLETLSQVSTSGGFDPHWDAAGRLYYLSQGSLMMQPIDLKTGIPAGRPSQLFRSDAVRFDLSADGQRFLFQVRNPEHPPLLVRTNWFDEIRTRLK